jgi:hypothetical protein
MPPAASGGPLCRAVAREQSRSRRADDRFAAVTLPCCALTGEADCARGALVSTGGVIPRVGMTLRAALILEQRRDMPHAHLDARESCACMPAQRAHERDHVSHGAVRQARPAHEFTSSASAKPGIVSAWIP